MGKVLLGGLARKTVKKLQRAAALAMSVVLLATSVSLDAVAAESTEATEQDGFTATTAEAGVTYNFNFGDTASGLWDLAEGEEAQSFVTLMKTGTTGLMTVTKAANWNSAQHGACRGMEVEIAVAGNSKISFVGCQFSGESDTVEMTSDTGIIVGEKQAAKVASCGTAIDYLYVGEAGSVKVSISGGYTHSIIVAPLAEDEVPDLDGGEGEEGGDSAIDLPSPMV